MSPKEVSTPEQWVKIARYILNFCVLSSFLAGLLGALMFYIAYDEVNLQKGELIYIIFTGVFLIVLGLGFGFLNLVVSRGLAKGDRWAWTGGVILGVMYLTSLFFPIGAFLLFSLFRAKKLFGLKESNTNSKDVLEE